MNAQEFYYKFRSSGTLLPDDVVNSIDGLVSVLIKLSAVVDKHNFIEITNKISRTLDTERIECLKIGFNEAVSSGNQEIAYLFRQLLLQLNEQSNITVNPKPASSIVIRFPYAESLLNNSEFYPVKSRRVLKENLHDNVNEACNNRWPYASKLLNETREVLQPVDIEKGVKSFTSKAKKYNEPISKEVVHSAQKVESSKSVKPSWIKRNNKDIIERLANFHAVQTKDNRSKTVPNPANEPKTDSLIKGEKNSLPIKAKKINPSDPDNRVRVGKRRRSDINRESDDVNANTLNKRTVNKTSVKPLDKRTDNSFQTNSKETIKSVQFHNLNDRKGNQAKAVKKIRKTPRVLKDDSKRDNLNPDSFSTPVRRRSAITKKEGSSVVTRHKRKHNSSQDILDSSGVHSSLRPKAKRYKSVQTTPEACNDNRKVCKKVGTLDVKNPCSNISHMSTTDMSSAYVETPKSTMSNRRGNVRILYKRILFSSPKSKMMRG